MTIRSRHLAGAALAALAVLLSAGALVVACNPTPSGTPVHVPAAWHDVRESAGHSAHVGKVECRVCHGDDGFAPPPAGLCTRCHAQATPLHPDDPTAHAATPTCTGCHAFGADRHVTPWGCMRCHGQDQGRVPAVGAHADQACSNCHQPHQTPATSPRVCTECHADRQTRHAGLRGCLDCHGIHEPTRLDGPRPTLASVDHVVRPPSADERCERCHSAQLGKLHVDGRALSTGHTACTSCHQPHQFAPRACTDCHKNQPVLAATKHTCIGCHDEHAGGAARACSTCHREQVSHPNTTHSPLGACVGCHPVHDKNLVAASTVGALATPAVAGRPARPHGPLALACTTCHAQQPSHATAQCLDCHVAHGPKPRLTPALCARCHADKTRTTAGTGHAACTTCHQSAAHKPASPRPACMTCHAIEAASAPAGHAACENCHAPHAPRPSKTCASCHAQQASLGHGTRAACTTCHRPHGPNGIPRPPACTTCHPADKRKGLHSAPHHADCASCHRSHEARPSDDRATCITCHKDRANHEPTAVRCATCHPFR